LAAANAEIDRLRALLVSQETPSETETINSDRLANVLEAIAQRLTREDSLNRSPKSTKIPDPPLLTDSKDPTFNSWKLQIKGKLQTNADHFLVEEDKMTYVFSRTGSNA